MPNEQQRFEEAKSNVLSAERYIDRIGKEYRGGGGGIGNIRSCAVKMTVYFQEYDGATNYHDAPDALAKALETVIMKNGKALLGEAIQLLRTGQTETARAFHAQMQSVANEIE